MMTAMSRSRFLISCRTCTPSMPGNLKSSNTRSKPSSRMRLSPSSPVGADSTSQPSRPSFCCSDQRTSFSSSIISILVLGMCELLLCLRSGLRCERLGFAGDQLQRKRRSVSRLAVYGNGAVMFLNDCAGDRKAEAGATMFGGKERREDFGEMLARNPNAGVPNLHVDDLAPIELGRFCGYGERPAAGHGLNAIQ